MRVLPSDSSVSGRLVRGLLGVSRIHAAVRFPPRGLKSMIRWFLFGLIGDILPVAAGLLRHALGPRTSTTRRRPQLGGGPNVCPMTRCP